MKNSQLAQKQYNIRTLCFMGGYIAVNIAAIFGAFGDAKGVGAWALGLVVAAPVIGHVWAFLTWIRDSDEFVSALMAKRFIIAAGIATVVYSTWGFLELYARAPHLTGAMIFPTIWLSFGIVSPFVQSTRS